MILLFNLNNIKSTSRTNEEVLHKLWMMYHRPYMLDNLSKYIGNSFLLNFRGLYSVKNTVDIAYIMQYIEIASRRSYFMYKTYAEKSLDLSFFPDIDKTAIKYNKLITIEQNKIYLKFE